MFHIFLFCMFQFVLALVLVPGTAYSRQDIYKLYIYIFFHTSRVREVVNRACHACDGRLNGGSIVLN